jgi:hypothetical protein
LFVGCLPKEFNDLFQFLHIFTFALFSYASAWLYVVSNFFVYSSHFPFSIGIRFLGAAAASHWYFNLTIREAAPYYEVHVPIMTRMTSVFLQLVFYTFSLQCTFVVRICSYNICSHTCYRILPTITVIFTGSFLKKSKFSFHQYQINHLHCLSYLKGNIETSKICWNLIHMHFQ